MKKHRDDVGRENELLDVALDLDLRAAVFKSVNRFLPMLEPELADVFRRAEILGQSHQAIATDVGTDADTVVLRLNQARTEVRRLLELSAHAHVSHPDGPSS